MKKLKIYAYSLIKSGLTTANIRVLSSIAEKYGNEIRYMSYRDIGKELCMNHGNVRYHFNALERSGYLTIEKQSAKKFVFHINVDKFNKLVNESNWHI